MINVFVSHESKNQNEIIELNLNLEIKVRNRTNQLQIANNQLNTFFEASIDLLCISSQDGFLRKVSRSFEHTLGYEIDELIDQRFLDFVHPDDLSETLKAMESLNEQRPVFRFINRYRTKQGDFKYIEWYSSPVGEFNYSVARDVTESLEQQRKLIEAREIAESSNAQKSHFLSRMSHELRTPMNSILGFAQLLEMTELSEMQESSTKHILKSGKHLLELINEVLEISRIESLLWPNPIFLSMNSPLSSGPRCSNASRIWISIRSSTFFLDCKCSKKLIVCMHNKKI